jgi:ATP-dependent DNA helicase RecG
MEEYAGGIQITFLKNDKVGDKVGVKVGDKVGDNLTENQNLILQYMTENQYITANELAAKVNISKRKIEENIAKLRQKGIIQRVGAAKTGHWEVIEKKKKEE